MTAEQIDDLFSHHPPIDDKVRKHDHVRNECRLLAHELNDSLPESREKSLALTNLQNAMMWANAAIAIHG